MDPDRVRIPYDEYNQQPQRSYDAEPKMYNQAYVDCLQDEIRHYQRLYRDLLVKTR